MSEMNLGNFFNSSLFFILVLFTCTSLGAKLNNDVVHLEETKTRGLGEIPKSLTIENLNLEKNNRKNKPTREPPRTSPAPTTVTLSQPSDSSTTIYRLMGENNIACILIQTDGLLEFQYTTSINTKEKGDAYMPERDDDVTGKCEDDTSFIRIPWKDFTWSIFFAKTPGAERWYISKMELTADSSNKAFQHLNRGRGILNFVNNTMLFPTPVGHAYTCSDETIVEMRDKDVLALIYLRNLKIQPFVYKKNDFGPEYYCLRGAKSYRDETAPIAVGSTLAIVTLLTVTGYGVYRYMKIKKVQYDTME